MVSGLLDPDISDELGGEVMSDRKLLEMAGKAAGYSIKFVAVIGECSKKDINARPWNPLENDGDALRLAVKLGISLELIPLHDSVMAHIDNENHSFSSTEAMDEFGARRAIVQVAAYIGSKPQ